MRQIVGLSSARTTSQVALEGASHRSALSKADLDRRLRLKRSKGYLAQMTDLDAGGHTTDQARFEALMSAVRAELPEVAFEQLPLGIVARCHLGRPYEVHTLDLGRQQIVRHYRAGEALPEPLERARALALHPAYAFIEVYSDALRAISEDGSVSVTEGV